MERTIVEKVSDIYNNLFPTTISSRATDNFDSLTSNLKKITSDKNTEIAFLKEQETYRKEFIGNISHELKTPITSIKALSEILLENDDVDNTTKNKFLSSILTESERISRLINNILDLEKLATGKEKLDLKLNFIESTIDKSINSVAQLALNKGIKINSVGNKNEEVLYDEDRIQQVLINLLSNAIKFSQENNGVVSVYTYVNQNKIEVSVENKNGNCMCPILNRRDRYS